MRPRPLPASLRGRPFTTHAAAELGVTPTRLRASDLERPHHGVRRLGARDDGASRSALQVAADFAPLLRDDECVAHVSALWCWGLPLRAEHESLPLHVASIRTRQRRRPGIVGHRYEGGCPWTTLEGVRVAMPVPAWLQAASELRLDELIVVGDALAGRWSPWSAASGVGLETLHEAVRSARGRPGVRLLESALEQVRPGVLSPRETALRLLVVRAGFPEPEINAPQRAPSGAYLGRPDLSWPDLRLGLEFEGDAHRIDRARWRSDLRRSARFARAGWNLLRVSDEDLRPPYDRVLLDHLGELLPRATPPARPARSARPARPGRPGRPGRHPTM